MDREHECVGGRYPSSLQDLGPSQALVVEQRRLLLIAVGDGLHLGVDRVQVPTERATLQPLPQRHALADVAVTALTQLWTQRQILLLIGPHRHRK